MCADWASAMGGGRVRKVAALIYVLLTQRLPICFLLKEVLHEVTALDQLQDEVCTNERETYPT